MTESELKYFCELVEEHAGIRLKETKYDLVKSRLRSRIEAHGFRKFSDYRDLLLSLPKNDPEWEVFINFLTTNKTDFFREPKHFSFLTERILPEWLKKNRPVFQVWSAACSTGEEPYTLAMVLKRALPSDRDFRILATDIDTDVLKSAKNAVFPISKKDEIPVDYRLPSLDIGKDAARGWFRVKPALKEKISFKQHNLITPQIPGEEIFDLVLCRNVLIYFGRENVDYVQRKLFSSVKTGGYFFIGHSESLHGLKHRWKNAGPSILKKER